MMKLLKTSNWVMTFMSITTLLFVASCGEDSEPEPEPIKPPTAFTYPATTVAVGATGTVTPSAVTGDAPIFTITDAGGAATFVSINATTGVISVAAESTTGTYSIDVKAANSAGNVEVTAEITIGINAAFDPRGKGYLWKYFTNQSDPWTLTGLDGIPGLPIQSVEIPKGWAPDWPTGNPDWNEEYLFPYLAVGGVADLLFQVPGDIACGAVSEKGDTTYFRVEDDLTLTTICHIDDAAGQSVVIGKSSISYAGGKYSWAITQYSQIEIVYTINNPTAETFIDPLDPAEPGRQFPAIRGMVDQFTIPTNVYDEAGILTSLSQKKVEVILEVIE